MNCPRCKTTVTQQDKYCPSCGLPLEAARTGGAKKQGGKKAYEEASTQLVDVDEFKQYMASEKSKGGAGNVSGQHSAPDLMAAGAASAPTSSRPEPQVSAARAPAPSPRVASAPPPQASALRRPVDEMAAPSSGRSRMVFVGVAVAAVLIVVAYLVMGGA